MQSQSDRDARTRDRAYQIWVSEGRRHGHHDAHWQQAQREIDAEEAGPAPGEEMSARATGAKKPPVTSEANPPTVSRARAEDEAAAKKPRSRGASADPATGARPKSTSRRRENAKA